jgi:hypothetical protein
MSESDVEIKPTSDPFEQTLFERFRDYVPGLDPEVLHDLIGAIAHEGWRYSTGRGDTVRSSSRLLTEAAEMACTAAGLSARVVQSHHTVYQALHDAQVEAQTEQALQRMTVLMQAIDAVMDSGHRLSAYLETIERNLREFATSWQLEKRRREAERQREAEARFNVINAEVKRRADNKRRVIRFTYEGGKVAGSYRVVINNRDVVVEYCAGFDGVGHESWLPVEGELRAVILAEVALRKAFDALRPDVRNRTMAHRSDRDDDVLYGEVPVQIADDGSNGPVSSRPSSVAE